MKHFIFLAFIGMIGFSSCSSLKNLALEPTSLETISAVKEVLNSSAFRAIATLRKLNKKGVDGFLPTELQPVLSSLKKLGMGAEMEKAEKKILQVSKIMAVESEGIIEDAIKELKFRDAVAIVAGGKNAATGVLKEKMYATVKNRYSSKLEKELGKTDVTQYWPIAANAYNLFAKKKVDGSLSDFMSERAVDALFIGMGKEESKIRQNPKKLGKQVVTKVFDYYAKKKG